MTISDGATLAKERGRLRFRAWHRGTREMDLLLGSFADAHIQDWDSKELAEFAELLGEPDVDLYDWYIGKTSPTPTLSHNSIFKQFQAHQLSKR